MLRNVFIILVGFGSLCSATMIRNPSSVSISYLDSSYLIEEMVVDEIVEHKVYTRKIRYLKKSHLDTIQFVASPKRITLTFEYDNQDEIDSLVRYVQDYVNGLGLEFDGENKDKIKNMRLMFKNIESSGSIRLELPVVFVDEIKETLVERYNLKLGNQTYRDRINIKNNLENYTTLANEINSFEIKNEYTFVDSLILTSLYQNLERFRSFIENERRKVTHQNIYIQIHKKRQDRSRRHDKEESNIYSYVLIGALTLSLLSNIIIVLKWKSDSK